MRNPRTCTYVGQANSSGIGELPVLVPWEIHIYPKWHSYFFHVYGEKVSSLVDLNCFTWFYWSAPVSSVSLFHDDDFTTSNAPLGSAPPNIAWVGSLRGHPEYIMGEQGFFVHRNERSSLSDLHRQSRLEVVRTCKPLHLYGRRYELDTSEGTVWFFAVVGSGIYVDTGSPFRGLFLTVADRPSLLSGKHFIRWRAADIDWFFLAANNVSALLIATAFSWQGFIPRGELVFRDDHREVSCCPSLLRFSRGFEQRHACSCHNVNGFMGCRTNEFVNALARTSV